MFFSFSETASNPYLFRFSQAMRPIIRSDVLSDYDAGGHKEDDSEDSEDSDADAADNKSRSMDSSSDDANEVRDIVHGRSDTITPGSLKAARASGE